ncbi:hypothetical protein SAMN05192566_1276 [Methylophilus rhizosphaerae]|uniref:DUF4175 domain-containing protein n=1 Tax=Methylophilus rhizosphaerae TaxID=492660 RepID=A0A1G9BPC2_9PROT|nr:hypothetical protein SAMN05192566_1276 [Methylophilus rhizosphaerae]
MNKRFSEIWLWPAVLAVLTAFGLLSALLGTGIWHWLSWVAISIPLIVIGYYWLQDKSRR